MKKTVLHILTGMARGGCEGNALCMILQTPDCLHRVLVLGAEGEMSAEFAAGAEVHYLNPPSRQPWRLSGQIGRKVKSLTPDGIIVWHGMVMLPQILHGLRDLRVPVLVHGGNPAHSMPRHVDWRYYLLEKALGRRADATYVCCSQYVADSFRDSRYLRRLPAVVVANGVRPLSVPPHEPGARSDEGAFTLGMVARLDAIKDHPTLIRAVAQVVKAFPQVRLEVVGDGDRRAELEALADEAGIAAQTLFLGQVADPYQVMQRWDAFAYATTEREGLGNALAEAMMLGLPCVATDIGPIAEVAGRPPGVLLVPPGDVSKLAAGIERLIAEEPLRRTLAKAGRARAVHEFSAGVFAQRYLSLLEGGAA